ncbi:PTS sugar transporter subunit IIB [Paucisalibacillus sp. EB02]|uniref:PTS sugar transporter subunit IIB n=1 Tax=Paucisalibacillus sp. EB02 TaxID=1347087 RepID=UPI0004B2D0E6|nr:PTS sugar transporter subunit IIB [Paucisalibacillus sp. EB02]
MSTKKKIIVACGTGVATSTAVLEKIKDIVRNAGLEVDFYQCSASSLKYEIDSVKPTLVVSTTPVSIDTEVPILKGLPFLTGLGVDEVKEQIISTLKN